MYSHLRLGRYMALDFCYSKHRGSIIVIPEHVVILSLWDSGFPCFKMKGEDESKLALWEHSVAFSFQVFVADVDIFFSPFAISVQKIYFYICNKFIIKIQNRVTEIYNSGTSSCC